MASISPHAAAAPATLVISGNLANTGQVLTFAAGQTVVLNGPGTITGGTIVDNGAILLSNGEVLSGVTYDGTLNLQFTATYGPAELDIANGLTVHGVDGTGNGTIDVGALGSQIPGLSYLQTLGFLATQTIDNATINLGNTVGGAGAITVGAAGSPAGLVLTLGKGLTINAINGSIENSYYNVASPQSVVNNGVINATIGKLTINTSTFVNNGTINAENGAVIDFYSQPTSTNHPSVTNTGTINIGSGSFIQFDTPLTNSGTINLASGSAAYLQTTLSGSSLANIVNQGGSIVLQGTVMGGTIAQAMTYLGGTLDGVTFDGTLDVEASAFGDGQLYIADGLIVHGASGSGNGTIDIGSTSGVDDSLIFDNAQIIDNATINLGSATGHAGVISDYDVGRTGGQTLTFGKNLTINVTNGTIGRDPGNGTLAESIVNEGAINVTTGTLTIDPTSFVNDGTISVSNGATLYLENAWTNAGTITVGAGSAIWLEGTGNNTGTIVAGSGSTVYITGNPGPAVLSHIVNNGGTIVETYVLTTGVDTIDGTTGTSVIAASDDTLSPGDQISAGSSDTSTLALQGGGQFNLAAPTTLTGIAVVDASEQTGAGQTVTMRNGLNVTVAVASETGGAIWITGANDADVFDLGKGADTLTLGSAAETVNGSGGTATINATAATAGATIHGGAGTTTLNVTGGGTVALAAGDTGITTVILKAAPKGQTQPAWNFTANAQPGLAIVDLSGAGDTIAVGSASQSVTTAAGSDVVLATAATAGAKVTGGKGTVLDVAGGGSFALNAATTGVTVKLDATSTIVLNNHAQMTVTGSSGGDTIVAMPIVTQDVLNLGGTGNTLVLGGAGTFNLNTATSITGIATLDVSEGQAAYTPAGGTALPATTQVVFLRNGTNMTVQVTDGIGTKGNPAPETIEIVGGNDADTIDLGAGTDTVLLGSAAETIVAGTGNASIRATAATAGALVTGNGAATALVVSGGGTVTMNAGDTGVGSVVLNTCAVAYDFASSAQSGLTITDRSTAGDLISVGGANTTVIDGAGSDTIWFHANWGQDVVQVFTATGTQHDILEFDTSVLSDWAHLLGATKQMGSDLLITLDATDTLLLKNVTLAHFTSSDVKFG